MREKDGLLLNWSHRKENYADAVAFHLNRFRTAHYALQRDVGIEEVRSLLRVSRAGSFDAFVLELRQNLSPSSAPASSSGSGSTPSSAVPKLSPRASSPPSALNRDDDRAFPETETFDDFDYKVRQMRAQESTSRSPGLASGVDPTAAASHTTRSPGLASGSDPTAASSTTRSPGLASSSNAAGAQTMSGPKPKSPM